MRIRRRRYLEALAGASVVPLGGCGEAVRGLRSETTTIHAPSTAAVTDSLDVEVTGVGTQEPVWVEAHTADGTGHRWFGRVLVESHRGRVSLGDARPHQGTYRNPASMGLFWSMQPADLDRLVYDADQRVQSVRLRVAPAGADRPEGSDVSPLAEATVDRWLAAPDSAETAVTDPVVGTLVESPTDGPAPGVLLFHGSSGNRPLAPARALASHGFTVLALQYFSPEHPRLPDALVEVPVEYADRAVEWLASHETTTGDPIGLGGFSRGGELALLVGTRHENVGAVVNWVGAGLLFNAVVLTDTLAVSERSPDTAAWTVDGEPLPHPSREEFEGSANLTEAYRTWLDETPSKTVEAAEIPLEQVGAPILFISAGDDGVWPSRYLQNRAERRLETANYGYRFEHHTYDEAGHGISVPFLPTWPNRPGGPFGGTIAGTAAAEADSWLRAVEFFTLGAKSGE